MSAPQPVRRGGRLLTRFEVLVPFLLLAFYMGYSDLVEIRRHERFAIASSADFVLMGVVWLYGIRVAMYTAASARGKLPAAVEWLTFIAPVVAFLVCAFGSGTLVKAYASEHGYRFCGARADEKGVFIFARLEDKCPINPYFIRRANG